MTVTLETLKAEFDEADFHIVDLIERLRLSYVRGGLHTAEYNRYAGDLFAALIARPVPFSCAITGYVLGALGLSFDPTLVEGWDENFDRCYEYMRPAHEAISPLRDGRSWMRRATLALIAARYGPDVALLYKLSDGAIDPRRPGDE